MQTLDRPSESVASKRPAQTLIIAALRLLVVPACLIWIVSQMSGPSWSLAIVSDWSALAGGLVINQIALCIFAARMQLVLRLFDVRIGWMAALRIHLQSMFYFFALPMTVGLEIARFFKIRQIEPSATVVQLSSALLLDRVLGAGSALAVAVLCLPFVDANIVLAAPLWIWPAAVGLLAALTAAAWLWPRTRRLLNEAWRLARGRWLGVAGLSLLSMIMHVVFAAGIQLAAKGVGLPLTLMDTVFAVAGGMLLVAIPVSFAGLGPAEAGAAGLFFALGYGSSVAVAAGALPYLARLLGALQGAAWEFVESGSDTLKAARALSLDRVDAQR